MPLRDWQRQHFGKSVFDDLELRTVGADVFIPEYESRFDGVIHCRKMPGSHTELAICSE